jgi:gamma-glutamyltranspeptidase/glutathione hydrolase
MPSFAPETVTVPGLLRGWETIWGLGAARPWASIFAVAGTQARDGVPLARSAAMALTDNASRLGSDPGMAEIFYRNGRALAENEAVVQARLAETLEQLAEHGAGAFYDGPIGRTWLDCMAKQGSPLAEADLAAFEPEVTEPMAGRFGRWEVLTAPPNSQGALLLRTLAEAERHGVSDPLSTQAAALARDFQDAAEARTRFLADPRRVGDLAGLLLGELSDGQTGDVRPKANGDTVALVAADGDGWAVTLIQSLFESFGCGVLDPATGIIAHNRGSFFSLDVDSPNVLAPGKRPAHTLTPVMVRDSGELRYVLGTMGGLAQTQILTHTILQLGLGRDIEAAIGSPRWIVGAIDTQGTHEVVQAEERVSRSARDALGQAGWDITTLPAFSLDVGESVGIERLGGGSGFEAAADPRGLGSSDVTAG